MVFANDSERIMLNTIERLEEENSILHLRIARLKDAGQPLWERLNDKAWSESDIEMLDRWRELVEEDRK